jgi:hypothetical protein
MDFVSDLDFLPTSINPKLRYGIYIIVFVHVAAVLIWILLLCRSMGKK